MSSWNDKRKNPDKSYGRKPYIIVNSENNTYNDMMTTIPRKAMLDQRLEKKSQFDKPYLTPNYNDMEYQQAPQIPSFSNPEFDFNDGFDGENPAHYSPGLNPITSNFKPPVPTEAELPVPGTWCAISCFAPLYCDEPVECHFGIIHGISAEELYGGLRAYINGAGASVGLGGSVRPIQIWPLGNWAAWPPSMDIVELEAWTKDENGVPILRCKTKLDVFCRSADCCLILPNGEILFDDANTSDTIVKNSNIEVYVTGGCPPFTFATSSTGYDFEGVASYETSDRNATLNCADGTCGVNFAVTCDLTVTDACDTVVSATILNTAGTWAYDSNVCGDGVGSSAIYSLPEGEYRYALMYTNASSCAQAPLCSDSCVQTMFSKSWNTDIYPTCGDGDIPFWCDGYLVYHVASSGWEYPIYQTRLDKQIWSCP